MLCLPPTAHCRGCRFPRAAALPEPRLRRRTPHPQAVDCGPKAYMRDCIFLYVCMNIKSYTSTSTHPHTPTGPQVRRPGSGPGASPSPAAAPPSAWKKQRSLRSDCTSCSDEGRSRRERVTNLLKCNARNLTHHQRPGEKGA